MTLAIRFLVLCDVHSTKKRSRVQRNGIYKHRLSVHAHLISRKHCHRPKIGTYPHVSDSISSDTITVDSLRAPQVFSSSMGSFSPLQNERDSWGHSKRGCIESSKYRGSYTSMELFLYWNWSKMWNIIISPFSTLADLDDPLLCESHVYLPGLQEFNNCLQPVSNVSWRFLFLLGQKLCSEHEARLGF